MTTSLVEHLRQQLATQKSELASIFTNFVVELGNYAGDWFRETGQYHFSTRSGAELSNDQKQALVLAVKGLSENARAFVINELGKPELWWHINERYAGDFQLEPNGTLPGFLEEPLRRVLGRLAPILESAKLVFIEPDSKRESHWVMKVDPTTGGKAPSYRSSFDLSLPARNAFINYCSLVKEATKTKDQLYSAEATDNSTGGKAEWNRLWQNA